MPQSIKQDIIDHLNGLNELERKTNSDHLIQVLANRYDVSVIIIEKTLLNGKRARIATNKQV